jgi:hypothetical protein
VVIDCKPPACCPQDPPGSTGCLDPLISQQDALMSQAETAKAFKAELVQLQQKSIAAKADYPLARYQSLLELWKAEDKDIVSLIDKLVCTLPCWRTQIECFVCPLLYDIRVDSERLTGKVLHSGSVNSLYDLRYWLQRELEVRQATYNRVRAVLAAWEKPGTTIEAVLTANRAVLDGVRKNLGSADAGKLLWDLLIRAVTMHLLIAPPATVATTAIDRCYVDLCPCDKGCPDDCCGPDTGVPSVLRQLFGPQPYLISPDQYDALVCCLVESRYLPAKDALSAVTAAAKNNDDDIARTLARIADHQKNLETNAKAKLALSFDCCKDGSGKGGTKTGCGCSPAPAPTPTPAPAPAPVPVPPPPAPEPPPPAGAPCPPTAAS